MRAAVKTEIAKSGTLATAVIGPIMFHFDPGLFHTFSFVAIFIASVAGSLHCIGMCGGLVTLAGSGSRGPLTGQLGYHLGRGVGYMALGALAGAFGELFIDTVKSVLMPSSTWNGVTAVGVLLGLCVLVLLFSKRRGDRLVEISDRSLFAGLRERLSSVPFTLGLTTAILPCPWLYSFVLLAAAAGDLLGGVQVMVAFWLGTIPALLVVGTLFEAAMRSLLKRYPLIQVVSIVLAFLFSLATHIGGDHVRHTSPHPSHGSHQRNYHD
jgi:uncharacterized protein